MSNPVDELKRELLAAAERQQHEPVRRGHTRLLAAAAVLAAIATASLLASAPWSSSPTFLAKAAAALQPSDDAVVHQRWVATTTSSEFGCTVTHRPSELWLDEAPPHRFRVLMNDVPSPRSLPASRRALACWDGRGAELGGSLSKGETFELTSPTTLRSARARFVNPVDLVADLRRALAAGTAHDEGEITQAGRSVRHIRVDPPRHCGSPSCPREPTHWYVDPSTFRPVGMAGPAGMNVPGQAFLALRVEVRFLVYEKLPRTATNLALTDIRAHR